MNKGLVLFVFAVIPMEVLAASQRSLTTSIIVNVVPIILFIITWLWLMRVQTKKTHPLNERIAESNERISEQLERIADHLEKNS